MKGLYESFEEFSQCYGVKNTNTYIDLNGKRKKLQTNYTKSYVFSYLFLTSIAFCVFICSDIHILDNALGVIATFKVPSLRTNLRKKKKNDILKKGDNVVLECNFEMHFMLI